MAIKGKRQERKCACGCGRQVAENIGPNGRFRGYLKYADGCHWEMSDDHRRKISKANTGVNHPKHKEVGSRRIHHATGNLKYWMIKISESGRWILEHRHLMQVKLGRQLMRGEHVHHVNGDTLDNMIDNLILLSHSEHSRHHGKQLHRDKKGVHAFPVCTVCGWQHPPH